MYTPTLVSGSPRVSTTTYSAEFSPERVRMLRRTFPGLDGDSLTSLTAIARERIIPRGVYLCREGQVEHSFYLICSGRVMISQNLEKDTTRTLAYRGAGEFIGEVSLLSKDLPRTATVMAVEETVVLEMEQARFEQLLQRSPSIVLAILRILATRQRESDQQTIGDLRQKYTELAHAYSRLKEETGRRSEFLTIVAHELRTPLTIIKGYLSLLRSGMLSGESLKQAVATVVANLDTMTRLVNNILLLQESDPNDASSRQVVLSALLNDLTASLRRSDYLPEGLSLRTEIAPDLPSVQGDTHGLTHAFGAILDNAVKFSPNGGEIVVRAYAVNGSLRVQICDPGLGIEPQVLPHIFDFHHLDVTGDHMVGGIGLGLPLAKSLIERHSGVIYVESEPGKGSTFTVVLPASPSGRPVKPAD